MSTRILPASAMSPVVSPVSLFLWRAGCIRVWSIKSKSTSTDFFTPFSSTVTAFWPNGRTMKTLVMTLTFGSVRSSKRFGWAAFSARHEAHEMLLSHLGLSDLLPNRSQFRDAVDRIHLLHG